MEELGIDNVDGGGWDGWDENMDGEIGIYGWSCRCGFELGWWKWMGVGNVAYFLK